MSQQQDKPDWKLEKGEGKDPSYFEEKDDAEDERNKLISLGARPEDLEVVKTNGEEPLEAANDKPISEVTGEKVEEELAKQEAAQVVDDDLEEIAQNHAQEIQAQQEGIAAYDDPIPNLPGWMKEEVKEHGGMDLNKDGCQVIANALDFEVDAEPDVRSHETDFEYACYTATVKRPDGRTYTAVGDCHIEEKGKQKKDLNRMAETRAKKRAVKWATAGGIEPFVRQ